MRISDFIEQSNESKSPGALLALMQRAAEDLGFDRYAYSALTHHHLYETIDDRAPAVAYNFPADWVDYYFDKNYEAIDPVLLYSPQLERPFVCDDLHEAFNADHTQRKILREASEAALKDGVGVPLHGPLGDTCLMIFASSSGHSSPSATLPELGVLFRQFHSAYREIGRAKIDRRLVADLSLRELECLRWIAVGKTSWEIGKILKISQNTVNYHVKNLLTKLEAKNRIAAVVEGYRRGLLTLDQKIFPT